MDSEAETVSLEVEAEAGENSPGALSPVGRSLPFLVNSLEAGSREDSGWEPEEHKPRCVVSCYIEPTGP